MSKVDQWIVDATREITDKNSPFYSLLKQSVKKLGGPQDNFELILREYRKEFTTIIARHYEAYMTKAPEGEDKK